MTTRTYVYLFAFVALGCNQPASIAEDPPKYDIVIDRPFEKGDRFLQTTESKVTFSESVYDDTRTLQSQKQIGEIKAELNVEVIQVSQKGKAVEIQYNVLSMEGTIDGAPVVPIPSGSVITAKASSSKVTRNGIPSGIHPLLIQLIEAILTAERDLQYTDQDGFGPPGPVAVNESWDINAEMVRETLDASSEIIGNSTSIRGRTTLNEVYSKNGQQIARVAVNMEATNLAVPLPPEMKIEEGTMTMSIVEEFPLNPEEPSLGQASSFALILKATGRGVTFTRNLSTETVNHYSYP